MHISTVRQDRAILLYELVKGYEVDLWRIIKELILEYVKGNFVGNIPHPSLITLLCIKGVVKFNDEEEERCPKTSPLTLTRVLKAPIESEERERIKEPTRKRKRIETQAKRTRETEELRGVSPVRDQTSTTISDEGESSEKMGGFEANLEQQVLSPVANHRVPAQTRYEERREESDTEKSLDAEQLSTIKQRSTGRMRATIEDSNNFELLAMSKEMKEELKER